MAAITKSLTRYFRGAGKFRLNGLKLGQVSNADVNIDY